ncbi:hypothetical protein GF386_02985 [Candidatus Pacearchaeota archaeon]|nr:hypothetical protein [Candidatus Pacearchaeota archaeon]MBD3283104.1 hypothetical protein [Candidatus Pacearchaeota archaeon]
MKKIILMFSVLIILVAGIVFISGKLDLYYESRYNFNDEEQTEVTEQTFDFYDLFDSGSNKYHKIEITNAVITKGTSKYGEEIIKIKFNDGGSMKAYYQDNGVKKIGTWLNFWDFKPGERNEIIFNKKAEIVEAHFTTQTHERFDLDYKESFEIGGYILPVPGGTKLDFDGVTISMKVQKGTEIRSPKMKSEKSKNTLIKYESIDGSTFKINPEFESKKLRDGIAFEGTLYFGIKLKHHGRDMGKFFIKDNAKLAGLEVNPGDSNLILDFLSPDTNPKYINSLKVDNNNHLMISEHVIGERTIKSTGICVILEPATMCPTTFVVKTYGYKLDMIKREDKSVFSVDFFDDNPFITGLGKNDVFSITAGRGVNGKTSYGDITLIEKGEEPPSIVTTGWNTFSFNGNNFYSGINEHDKIHIYNDAGQGDYSESSDKISIIPYTETYEKLERGARNPAVSVVRGSKKWELYQFADIALAKTLTQFGSPEYIKTGPRVVVWDQRTGPVIEGRTIDIEGVPPITEEIPPGRAVEP